MSLDQFKDDIQRLRNEVSDILTPVYGHDYDLLRWVKGWKSDMEKILPRLKAHMENRKAYGMDDPNFGVFKPGSHEERVFNALSTGFGVDRLNMDTWDKDGNLLIVFKLGEIDLAEIQKRVSCRDYIWYNLAFGELVRRRLLAEECKLGRPLAITFVEDIAGIHITKMMRDCMNGPARVVSWFMPDNFPEQASKFIMVNAPKAVDVLLNLFKHFLPPPTREKFHTVGSDYEPLVEMIGAENLPPEYGGTANLKVPVPCIGLSSDFTLYPTQERPSQMKVMHLRPKQSATKQIPRNTKSITWFFETDSVVLFSLKESDPNGHWVTIIPPLPIDTYYRPETDSIPCKANSIYEIKFDNQSTLLLSAQISYCIITAGSDNTTKVIDLED